MMTMGMSISRLFGDVNCLNTWDHNNIDFQLQEFGDESRETIYPSLGVTVLYLDVFPN